MTKAEVIEIKESFRTYHVSSKNKLIQYPVKIAVLKVVELGKCATEAIGDIVEIMVFCGFSLYPPMRYDNVVPSRDWIRPGDIVELRNS